MLLRVVDVDMVDVMIERIRPLCLFSEVVTVVVLVVSALTSEIEFVRR